MRRGRIVAAHLLALATAVNLQQGTPRTAFTAGRNGHLQANVGHYFHSYEVGGWQLMQLMSNGSERPVLGTDRYSTAEQYLLTSAFLTGLKESK